MTTNGGALIPAGTAMSLRALAAAVLVLAPFGYLGILAGVAVHETLGHGLTSLAVGGEFIGFQMDFDGMGYALVPLGAEHGVQHQVIVLAGGVAATSLLGLALFVFGYFVRRRPWVSLPLIILSFGLLMDGIPYVFWNAFNPSPPGDIGRIITLTENHVLRFSLLGVSGVLMVAVTWAFTTLLFVILQSWFTNGNELDGRRRTLLLLILGVGPGMAWFTFDWNQLAPGLGVTPNIVGFGMHVAAAATLLALKPRPLPMPDKHGIAIAGAVGWGVAATSIVVVAMWLREGVFF